MNGFNADVTATERGPDTVVITMQVAVGRQRGVVEIHVELEGGQPVDFTVTPSNRNGQAATDAIKSQLVDGTFMAEDFRLHVLAAIKRYVIDRAEIVSTASPRPHPGTYRVDQTPDAACATLDGVAQRRCNGSG